jgi:hypothetical protein
VGGARISRGTDIVKARLRIMNFLGIGISRRSESFKGLGSLRAEGEVFVVSNL